MTTKNITLIRHGVALHNICDENTGAKPNLHDPKFTDSPLTRRGEQQARQLGNQLRKLRLASNEHTLDGGVMNDDNTAHRRMSSDYDPLMDKKDDIYRNNNRRTDTSTIDLVICSPLTRCLQTAMHIFPNYFTISQPPSDKATSTKSHAFAHVVLDRNCKVCCHGDVREAYGMNYSDKRSPLSQLKSKFPTVQYHPSITEYDDDWQPHTRETWQDVSRRVHNFFHWLVQQPHMNIAIVTHGVWMECALLNYCPEVLHFGEKRVYNCDVYSGKLSVSSDGKSITFNDVVQITF